MNIPPSSAIVIVTKDFLIHYANEIFQKLTGHSEIFLRTARLSDFIYCPDLQAFAMDFEVTPLIESVSNTFIGEVINSEANSLPVTLKVSRFILNNSSCLLIEFPFTGQSLINIPHANELNLLHQLMENIPVSIYIKDTHSRYVLTNRHLEMLMGVTSKEMILGKTDFDFYPQTLAQKYRENEIEILEQGVAKINLIEKVPNATKKLRWYSITKIPLYDEGREITGILGIGRDITESVKEKEQLKKAKKAAEKADQLKSAFLANMSHEIRTPLNAILGFSQIMRNTEISNEKRNKYLDIIMFNGKQLLELINDIIDISKIDSGQISLNYRSISINLLLDNIVRTFQKEISSWSGSTVSMNVTYGLPDQKCFIITDEFRLKQVLLNLISNAQKFTFEGSINIGYTIKNKYTIQFYVKDTGIGIPPEKLKLIFERFRQADETITRKFGGAGLGLSISRGLIKLMGGDMWVESNENTGSSFYFTLPYHPEKREKETPKSKNELEKGPDWQGKTVMIAEDDENSLKLVSAWLKAARAKVIFAKNGNEAVEKVSQDRQIDLVLMDIKLPGINGLEATVAIKEINKEIPVIAQTAYALSDDREKCLRAGCDDYISKPINAEMFYKTLDKYLHK